MATQSVIVDEGRANFRIFDFPEPGDILAEHTHTADDVHFSVLVAGKAMMTWNGDTFQMVPGKIYKIKEGEPHSIFAVTPARVINIVYGGKT